MAAGSATGEDDGGGRHLIMISVLKEETSATPGVTERREVWSMAFDPSSVGRAAKYLSRIASRSKKELPPDRPRVDELPESSELQMEELPPKDDDLD
jgi:hypothetical protein